MGRPGAATPGMASGGDLKPTCHDLGNVSFFDLLLFGICTLVAYAEGEEKTIFKQSAYSETSCSLLQPVTLMPDILRK